MLTEYEKNLAYYRRRKARIKKMRGMRGYSYAKIGRMFGISATRVQQIMKGQR